MSKKLQKKDFFSARRPHADRTAVTMNKISLFIAIYYIFYIYRTLLLYIKENLYKKQKIV